MPTLTPTSEVHRAGVPRCPQDTDMRVIRRCRACGPVPQPVPFRGVGAARRHRRLGGGRAHPGRMAAPLPGRL